MIQHSEIINAYNFRHACKVFDASKKIDAKDFDTILETARLSPSSFGFEPWKFLIVQETQHREALRPFTWGAQKMLSTASHFVIILARKQEEMHYNSEYILHMMKDVHHLSDTAIKQRHSVYKKFQEDDFKLLQSPRTTFDWAAKQSYIALGNMMSSAAMLGIDSCAIEGFEADKIQEVMVKEFGMESSKFGVACMVAFGYRINDPRPKTRQNMDDIVQWIT